MTMPLTIPPMQVGETSQPCVMKSAAGYYVGTYYRESFGPVPNSRDSEYFSTAEEAQSYLNSLNQDA